MKASPALHLPRRLSSDNLIVAGMENIDVHRRKPNINAKHLERLHAILMKYFSFLLCYSPMLDRLAQSSAFPR